jgi:AcrR family transcriptional regulator
MGTTARKDREREAVRRSILNAARELFVTEGYRNVSMRKIAERIEYSPAAIYSYFENKDDIFFALAEEGFQLLFATPMPEVDPRAPLDAVRAIIWHFYSFSKTHPEYFDLMFVDRSVPRISRDWERFGFVLEGKRACAGVVRQCIDQGLFPGATDPYAVFRLLSTAVYGAAVFRLTARLPAGENADALAHDILEAALAGLQAGSPITLSAADCPATAEGAPVTDPEATSAERAHR